MRSCSTAAIFSEPVVLLRLDDVARVSCYMRLLDLVIGLLLIAASAIVLVCDHVLRAGVLLLTVNLVWMCLLLRALFFANI